MRSYQLPDIFSVPIKGIQYSKRMLQDLFLELLDRIFQIFIDSSDIVTLVRLRLTCQEYNRLLTEYHMTLPNDLPLIIMHGHLDLLKRILADANAILTDASQHLANAILTEENMYLAVCSDHLPIIIWMWENGVLFTAAHYKKAAYRGYFQILEWASTLIFKESRVKGLKVALRRDLTPAETWVHNDIGSGAILGQKLKVLEWAQKKGFPVYSKLYITAIFMGDLEVVQWLWRQGLDLNPEAKLTLEIYRETHTELYDWVKQQPFLI